LVNDKISEYLTVVFIWFSIISIIIGCFGAIVQNSLKRFFAYTSINQSGFIVMGLLTNSIFGLESSLLYIIVYMASMLLFFYVVCSYKISDDIAEINKLQGFHRLGLIAALFSMAGIPPLFGFGSKYIAWLSLFDVISNSGSSTFHSNYITVLLIVSISVSLISAFYYLRLIKIASFKDVLEFKNDGVIKLRRMGWILLV
jgi:NADH-quinone oxidoreductase subunit N